MNPTYGFLAWWCCPCHFVNLDPNTSFSFYLSKLPRLSGSGIILFTLGHLLQIQSQLGCRLLVLTFGMSGGLLCLSCEAKIDQRQISNQSPSRSFKRGSAHRVLSKNMISAICTLSKSEGSSSSFSRANCGPRPLQVALRAKNGRRS